MRDGVRMHAVGRERRIVQTAQRLVNVLLRVDEVAAGIRRHALADFRVAQHRGKKRVALVRFKQKRSDERKALQPLGGDGCDEAQVFLVFFLGNRAGRRHIGVEVPPNVVDADEQRRVVGADGVQIALPTAADVAARFAADAGVDQPQALFGTGRGDERVQVLRIAAAQPADIVAVRARAAAVGDRIAAEQNRFAVFNRMQVQHHRFRLCLILRPRRRTTPRKCPQRRPRKPPPRSRRTRLRSSRRRFRRRSFPRACWTACR